MRSQFFGFQSTRTQYPVQVGIGYELTGTRFFGLTCCLRLLEMSWSGDRRYRVVGWTRQHDGSPYRQQSAATRRTGLPHRDTDEQHLTSIGHRRTLAHGCLSVTQRHRGRCAADDTHSPFNSNDSVFQIVRTQTFSYSGVSYHGHL